MEFIKRIFVSFIISCPIIIYFMQNWLDNFAYRVEFSLWMLAFPGLLTLVISITIVTMLTFYTSTRNPENASGVNDKDHYDLFYHLFYNHIKFTILLSLTTSKTACFQATDIWKLQGYYCLFAKVKICD